MGHHDGGIKGFVVQDDHILHQTLLWYQDGTSFQRLVLLISPLRDIGIRFRWNHPSPLLKAAQEQALHHARLAAVDYVLEQGAAGPG